MTTATYRGVEYNVEERRVNSELILIKKQLEEVKRRQDTLLANTKISSVNSSFMV